MVLSRPSELMHFLATLGVSPKKRLSQNFLIDGNILRNILKEANIQAGDLVLEIGAGPGALTEVLLEKGAEVVAVEKDPIFAQALKRFPSLEVFAGDIRDFPLDSLQRKAKVVSNLPYHLTTPILAMLAPRHDLFSTVTVMVQEEVARRMTAYVSTSEYGSLTLFLQFYATLHYAFKVSKRCFYPQPKVDSAIVTLTLKKPPLASPEKFFDMVHTAFKGRRKTVRKTLGEVYGVEKILSLLKDPHCRPENLSLDDFLFLYHHTREEDGSKNW